MASASSADMNRGGWKARVASAAGPAGLASPKVWKPEGSAAPAVSLDRGGVAEGLANRFKQMGIAKEKVAETALRRAAAAEDVGSVRPSTEGKFKSRGGRDAPPEEKVKYNEENWAQNDLLVYRGQDLASWKGSRPSQIYKRDGYHTIQVASPYEHCEVDPLGDRWNEKDGEFAQLDAKFKRLASDRREDTAINETTIMSLAREFRLTSGKWMVMGVDWKDVDRLWGKMVTALLDGGMPGVIYIKTPGRDDSSENPHLWVHDGSPQTKIDFVTGDYTDRDALVAVESNLRRLGVSGDMRYKPDIYTRLEIFARNDYGIPATIYRTEGRQPFSALENRGGGGIYRNQPGGRAGTGGAPRPANAVRGAGAGDWRAAANRRPDSDRDGGGGRSNGQQRRQNADDYGDSHRIGGQSERNPVNGYRPIGAGNNRYNGGGSDLRRAANDDAIRGGSGGGGGAEGRRSGSSYNAARGGGRSGGDLGRSEWRRPADADDGGGGGWRRQTDRNGGDGGWRKTDRNGDGGDGGWRRGTDRNGDGL